MAWIRAYGCATAAGSRTADFMAALNSGLDLSRPFPGHPEFGTMLFPERDAVSIRELLGRQLQYAFREVASSIEPTRTLGVILASTKGFSNDFIWTTGACELNEDPLTPLLCDFITNLQLPVARQVVVSNACSSALAGLALGQKWLDHGIDQVLLISADAVTPFVLRGFQALRVLTQKGVRPFSADRDGFYLGEAAACILLSNSPSKTRLYPVGLDTEGAAVTRPASSSLSLVRAIERVGGPPPDVVIAHGTGTWINDQTEDLAFAKVFAAKPSITGSKWCVGHTLAVSGALDIIAAAEILRQQQVFALHTTQQIDPAFSAHYLTQNTKDLKCARVQVTSLGFGGMHASALVERSAP